ncbi:hypothetical protein BDF21DRAFT_489657 [Thamnidium elegans]|uniref:Uncharacterized protein n=1 Tax=Thamnidium elegans TaxID=101142 RepID=A0A8H7SUB1_9FUNG|nr:hypothetical protein INT48_005001 [Thamnidium elegans]KAI8094071.1 hypothetical protein BDF21DRAFT_489657 [Thamnidium elegans]
MYATLQDIHPLQRLYSFPELTNSLVNRHATRNRDYGDVCDGFRNSSSMPLENFHNEAEALTQLLGIPNLLVERDREVAYTKKER